VPGYLGTTEFIDENALQVNLTRLKKTMTSLKMRQKIVSVRGVGYKLIMEENSYEANWKIFKQYAPWLLLLLCVDGLAAVLLWLADVQAFYALMGFIILATMLCLLWYL